MSLFHTRTVRPSAAMETPELDVTPVMNLLIILIPFLVSMAVFTRLAVLSFSLPSNVGSGTTAGTPIPKPKLTIVIAEEYCAITSGETMLDSLTAPRSVIDSKLLAERLRSHRTSAADADEVIVAVRSAVSFDNVVKVMDICKQAGFSKIGLSNATEDPHAGV